jgi:hypothetical protein
VTNLGGTSAHELVDALLAALRTLHHLVGAKNQTFKFFAALLANILENGHLQFSFKDGRVQPTDHLEAKIKSGYLALRLLLLKSTDLVYLKYNIFFHKNIHCRKFF